MGGTLTKTRAKKVQVGEMIKQYREEAGFTQVGFAEALDVARSTLAGWETGKRNVDVEALVKASEVLQKDPGVLLGFDPQKASEGIQDRLVNIFRAEGYRKAMMVLDVPAECILAVVEGKLMVPFRYVEELAAAYNVSFDWLLTGRRTKWGTKLKGNPSARLRFLRILLGIPIEEAWADYWPSLEANPEYFRLQLRDPNSRLNSEIAPAFNIMVGVDKEMLAALRSDPEKPLTMAWEWVVEDQLD